MLRLDINIVWTILNLLIIFAIVKIFLIKPIHKILDERQAQADSMLTDAVKAKEEAEALGLAGAPASPEAPAAPKEPPAAEIKAELDALGVAYAKKAKKADLKELLAEAKAGAAPEGDQRDDDAADDEPDSEEEAGDGGDE